MTRSIGTRSLLAGSGLVAAALFAVAAGTPSARADDAVEAAKAAVAKYAGPQTTWEGPTSAPKPDAGKKIVFLSGDEQNDISHLYGQSTSRRPERSSAGTSPSSTARAARRPGSPA